MSDTIFDKIVRKEIPSRVVWEDEGFMAFLTPFPNTPGVTVVIPKTNPGDYLFALEDEVYQGVVGAAKKVARVLEKAFDVRRVAMVVEGTGVAYVHVKLYPLYGQLANETEIFSDFTEFTSDYRGYITTIEGPKMDDAQLDEIQAKIIGAQG